MGRFPNIAASKAKTGAAKAKVYSSYAKEIYQVAKQGGTDPNGNLSLRHLIEKAKKEQVPADVIKRAIDKVNSGSDESYTSVRYEGFASGGATVMVDCLTDNVNRTVSLVRNAFTKSKGKMGVSGCVSHMYEHLSVVIVKDMTEDEQLKLLATDGMLVKRPLVIGDDFVLTGFREKEWIEAVWSQMPVHSFYPVTADTAEN